MQLFRFFHCLPSVGRLADHFNVRLRIQHTPETTQNHPMIIGQ
jgi:hypothetical protein